MKFSSLAKIICGIAGVVILDQWTKVWFSAGRSIALIGSFLRLETTYNTGIAFSIPITGWFLIFVTVLILSVFIWFTSKYLRTASFLTELIIALILGGGIGNLIDRVLRGSVVDFIRVGSFPVFNIADIAVVVGGLCLFLWYDSTRLQSGAVRAEKHLK